MAVAQGYGKTVTSGSVFAYDTGDTRNSYIGEPTTNIYSTDGYSFWQLNGNHTATRYTGNAPDLTTILNNYDYHTIVTTGNWSNEVDRALLWTNSGLLQLNTQYAVSFYARVISTSTANIGAAFYGNALPNSLTLTNQWQRFTVLTSTTATFRPFEFGSKSGAITFQVAGIQYEAKSHSTPYVNGTRSATQGLLPLVGNSTIDLSNVSFDSNAKLYFDGTNDYFTIPYSSNLDTPNGCTYELMVYPTGAGEVINRGTNDGVDNPRIYIYANGAVYFDWSSGGTDRNVTSSTNLTMNTWNHLVCTATPGSALKIYINSLQVASGTTQPTPLPNTSNDIEVGRASWLPRYGSAKIDILKIYNRALSAAEVRQNYLHYKTRFNLS
jgi:hypothetical protein